MKVCCQLEAGFFVPIHICTKTVLFLTQNIFCYGSLDNASCVVVFVSDVPNINCLRAPKFSDVVSVG